MLNDGINILFFFLLMELLLNFNCDLGENKKQYDYKQFEYKIIYGLIHSPRDLTYSSYHFIGNGKNNQCYVIKYGDESFST